MKFGLYKLMDASGVTVYVGKGAVREDGTCSRWREHERLGEALRDGRPINTRNKVYRVHHWLSKRKAWSWGWIATGLKEKEAYAMEREVVLRLREELGKRLLNSAEGGRGMSSKRAKEIANRPEVKRKKSKALTSAWQDPEKRAAWSGSFKESNGRPYRREQARQKALEEWSKEERREAARKRAKELWADPVWAAARRSELTKRNKGLA